jgi:hypothetical protein
MSFPASSSGAAQALDDPLSLAALERNVYDDLLCALPPGPGGDGLVRDLHLRVRPHLFHPLSDTAHAALPQHGDGNGGAAAGAPGAAHSGDDGDDGGGAAHDDEDAGRVSHKGVCVRGCAPF